MRLADVTRWSPGRRPGTHGDNASVYLDHSSAQDASASKEGLGAESDAEVSPYALEGIRLDAPPEGLLRTTRAASIGSSMGSIGPLGPAGTLGPAGRFGSAWPRAHRPRCRFEPRLMANVIEDGSSIATDEYWELPRHKPWFCALAFIVCSGAFAAEMQANDWNFQPFSCPKMCERGPCFEDGTKCEANPLLGPTMGVMDQLGAKNDEAIFGRGEWW